VRAEGEHGIGGRHTGLVAIVTRIPQVRPAGLAPKTVRNVHIMLHRALADAVGWRYLSDRLHDVRHSYATAALRAGINPKIVSHRIVHSSAAFTLNVYSHVTPGIDRSAASEVAELLLAPPSTTDPE
jgi:integrase